MDIRYVLLGAIVTHEYTRSFTELEYNDSYLNQKELEVGELWSRTLLGDVSLM